MAQFRAKDKQNFHHSCTHPGCAVKANHNLYARVYISVQAG